MIVFGFSNLQIVENITSIDLTELARAISETADKLPIKYNNVSFFDTRYAICVFLVS